MVGVIITLVNPGPIDDARNAIFLGALWPYTMAAIFGNAALGYPFFN